MAAMLILAFFTLIVILYSIGLVVYRLFLHPVAKFPGPKLAAASFWYEFYYDVVRRGRYFKEIEKMHAQYGELYLEGQSICWWSTFCCRLSDALQVPLFE
jgi:hypothetical protein